MKKPIRSIKDALFDFCYRILMLGSNHRGLVRAPYGKEELKRVHEALRSQRLFRWNGKMVSEFEKSFADVYGVPHAVASTSGTSAIHIALGAMDIKEGDEIITTPITDMGTIVPILSQRATPVFADVDDSFNLNPTSLEQRITERTRAIIVVHVFGNPCNMDSILSIAKRYNLRIVEDCAQAQMSRYKGQLLGTIGDIGCYSFQESKHLTTGDGGMTISKNSEYGERMKLFADKGFDRKSSDQITYRFHAPNYRMNELTAAVGLAQLGKVAAVAKRRNQAGSMLTDMLSDLIGVRPAPVTPGGYHVFWAYPLYVEDVSIDSFIKILKDNHIPAGKHMTTPIYFKAASLQHFKPVANASRASDSGLCPKAESLHNHLAILWMNENWGEKQIQHVAKIIKMAVRN
jgi:dTDP-4-amino-4,6-dideoxygalactose transaminase